MSIRLPDDSFGSAHTSNTKGTGLSALVNAAKNKRLEKASVKPVFNEDTLVAFEEEVQRKNEKVAQAVADENINLVEFLKIVSSDKRLKEMANTHGYEVLFGILDKDHDAIIGKEELQKLYGEDSNIKQMKFADLSSYLLNNVSKIQTNEKQSSTNVDNVNSVKMLKVLKKAAQDSLSAQTENLNEIYRGNYGDNEVLNDSQQAFNDAKAELDKSFQNSNNPDMELWKNNFYKLEENIMAQNAIIDKQAINMNNAQEDMLKQYGDMCTIMSQIDKIDAAISELEAQKGENKHYLNRIQVKINKFTEQRNELEAQKAKTQEAYQEAYTRYISAKEITDTAKSVISRLTGEKGGCVRRINNLNDVQVNEALANYLNAQRSLERSKNGAINETKAKLAKIKETIYEIDTKISTLKIQKIDKDKHVNTMGDDIVDFASQYDGKTASEMKKIITSAGGTFGSSWCADFVKYIWTSVLGDNLPEWYKEIDNPSLCERVRQIADEKAVRLEDDIANAKPGDYVLFDWNGDGRADHAGIIDYIEFDDKGNVIAVHTIEGNTTDGTGSKRVVKLTYTYDYKGAYGNISSIMRIYSLEQKKEEEDS